MTHDHSRHGLHPAGEQSLVAREGSPPAQAHDLIFRNGLGGFTRDGREYIITLAPGQATPAPWVNVIANAGFGFQVSAEGSGYTWSVNSRENQITAWSNDPVSDPSSEAYAPKVAAQQRSTILPCRSTPGEPIA